MACALCTRPDNARELFDAYRYGWTSGADGDEDPALSFEPDAAARAECARGYADGLAARRAALEAASDRLGFRTAILRKPVEDPFTAH